LGSSNDAGFLAGIEMGLGAWAWGDRAIWQYGRGYTDADIREAFRTSMEQGIRLVDTAEVYGSGRSERLLGNFARESSQPVLVATKFFPWPWRLRRSSIISALRASLARLGLENVALYQIHWPTPLLGVETMMEGMLTCVEAGLTRALVVSNFSQTDMLGAYAMLARHNVPLASNQVHYSLLERRVEKNGLLARCHELGIRLIAYSPLEMGLLTGKYSPANPPPASRTLRYVSLLGRIAPLLKLMTKVGQDHGGKSNAQVALNWVLAKGALPIPGAKTQAQALQNAGALGWKLTDDEVADLDRASDSLG
jgi:aryl-alcohol dehydrogenase-like predicted oxidoreductase